MENSPFVGLLIEPGERENDNYRVSVVHGERRETCGSLPRSFSAVELELRVVDHHIEYEVSIID